MTVKGYLVVSVLGALVLLVYMAQCLFRPYAACWKCKGDGKFRSRSGRSWRKCRRCRHTGERKRIGRVIADWIYNQYKGRK